MDIKKAILKYLEDKYITDSSEHIYDADWFRAGIGYAVHFTIEDMHGFLEHRNTWVSGNDLGPYLNG